jgi:hypothetical protein
MLFSPPEALSLFLTALNMLKAKARRFSQNFNIPYLETEARQPNGERGIGITDMMDVPLTIMEQRATLA